MKILPAYVVAATLSVLPASAATVLDISGSFNGDALAVAANETTGGIYTGP
ncbi:MAG: hypothetical protein KJO79_09570 [Verrucomicrobiae bacterium]|nr:hypothetical protein [Verrucomicrobiae bacterium]